jgi:type II secretory pathway component GspD/PulD (secretin)
VTRMTAIVALLVAGAAVTASAQGAAGQPQAAPPFAKVSLELQVVISTYRGEKKLSAVPYVLALNSGSGPAQLNVGAEVPVTTTTFAPAGDAKPGAQPLRSYNYRSVGTNISASATSGDGVFELELSVDETSVATNVVSDNGRPSVEMPVFKNFKTRNKLLLRNGQTRQFTAATDRVSGETVRIEVTLTVVK